MNDKITVFVLSTYVYKRYFEFEINLTYQIQRFIISNALSLMRINIISNIQFIMN